MKRIWNELSFNSKVLAIGLDLIFLAIVVGCVSIALKLLFWVF